MKPLEIQSAQHHFNFKMFYKKQCTAGEIPHLKPTDFDVTKHSDYFVWKDKSQRVTRRCDDTVDKKRVNSCVLKHLFWREFSNQKPHQKFFGSALSDALLMARLLNLAADATLMARLLNFNIYIYVYIYGYIYVCMYLCMHISNFTIEELTVLEILPVEHIWHYVYMYYI